MPILIIVQAQHAAASGTSWWTIAATVIAAVAAIAALVTVALARVTVLDGRDAHSEEMDQRSHAFVAETRVQRHVHASRLADVMIAIARAAHEETLPDPAPADTSQRPSIIPSLQVQFRAELAAFRALDVPDLPLSDRLADEAYGDLDDKPYRSASPADMRRLAMEALAQLGQKVAANGRFSLKLDANRRLADLPAPADTRTRRGSIDRLIERLFKAGK